LLELPSRRRVLVSDTVGFIRNLPHSLIKAFSATLEEVREAEMIVRVLDCSAPDLAQQEEEVEKVLDELGALDKPCLRVQNKTDLLSPEEREARRGSSGEVFISAKTGEGMEKLLNAIDRLLLLDPVVKVRLRFTQQEGKQLSWVYGLGRVLRRDYAGGYIDVDAEVPQSLARRLQKHLAGPNGPHPQ
ncbi:MAG: GTPase HflX, partial [Acidobacteria bacterium]|nr:GTPase HflX [Acidobacteriota bacterium]